MKNPNRFYFKNGVILPLTDEKPADYLLTSTDEFSVLKDVFPGSIARVQGKEYQLDPNGNWEEKAGSSPEEIKNRIRFYIKDGHICPLGDDLPSEYYVATMDELAQLAPLVFPGSIAYVNGQKYELDPHGDWDRKAEGGGGGATTMEDLLDVVVNEPTEGQVLVYDDYNDKWKNQDAPTGLPDVTTADEGKLLTVDSEGEWAAIELQVAPGEVVIDNTLQVVGAAADAKAAGDRIRDLEENKANIDGYYEQMTVGNAEQLVATVGVEDEVPYLLRTAGGTADIGNRETDKIIGGTVAWNQLVQNGNFEDTSNWSTSGFSIAVENNVATLTASSNLSVVYQALPFTSNHKYMFSEDVKAATNGNTGHITIGSTAVATFTLTTGWQRIEIIYDYGSMTSVNFNAMRLKDGNSVECQLKNVCVFDLTQMFGTTIADYIYSLETAHAGAGVAWFRKYFPKPYYAYNAGELLSVNTSAHKTTGFNQFNGTVNLGYRWNNGEYVAANLNYAATNDRTPCVGGTTYCFYFPGLTNTISIYVQEFDAAGNWLRSKPYTSITTTNKYATVTASADARFIAISLYKEQNFVSADVAQVCINLHWDGERDGEYEPYTLHEYPLDSSLTLRGIPKLDANNELYYDGDEYESDGTVTRKYGVVDAGTLNWTADSNRPGVFYANISGKERSSSSPPTNRNGVACKKYSNKYEGVTTTDDKYITDYPSYTSTSVFIRDSAYAGYIGEQVATALSGIDIVFRLATPTTESADPFQNPQIVDDFGTEEYVDAGVTDTTPTRDVAIPVGHVTTYQANLRAKLEMAPESPDGDGYYLVHQNNGLNTYSRYTVDASLTSHGVAADAEVTGTKISHLEEEVKDLSDAVFGGNNWNAIKELVDSGEAANVLQIGDQISDTWEKAAGTSYVAPWDVVHHFSNGDMALNWHYTFADGIQFDAPEAIYYAPAGGLAAGQYYISIGTAYGTGWVTTKHINFTLTSDMDADDQLYIECSTNNANDPTDGKTWKVFGKGSTTVKQTGTTSDSTAGTNLGTIGAANAHKPEGNLNAISRVVYGYGRWSQSAHRQWLNSSANAGAWWTPQNPWDRPPAEHSTIRGFLAGLSQELLDILQPVSVVTALNTQEGFAETSETTQDKIFLPSLQEMYINPELANVEGVDWDYNKALAAEAGLTGKFQRSSTYEILKKYNVSSKSSAVVVFLRSCVRSGALHEWCIYSSGGVGYSSSSYALRGCPACIIKKSV